MSLQHEMRRNGVRWFVAGLVALAVLGSVAAPTFGQAEPTPTPLPPGGASVTATASSAVPSGTASVTASATTPLPTTSTTPLPATSVTPAATGVAQPAPSVPHDERFFADTGFRIDNDAIWAYFQARGRLQTFGFPVSRTFGFLGCQTQIFQRQVAQVCSGPNVQLMNLLDPEIFPYTRVNNSTFPGPDDSLKNSTPRVGDPTYGTAIIDFVRTNAPDTFENSSVGFGRLFFSSISATQANVTDQNILNVMDLEVWGTPISKPARDPNNSNFVYQRFQRGIMHFDASSGATNGILLADYLKQLLLGPQLAGTNLPTDLAAQAQGSRMLAQYCPGAAAWVCRPSDLPSSDLTFAFERDTTAGTPVPAGTPGATATTSASMTPIPGAATGTPSPAASTTPAGTGTAVGTPTAEATLATTPTETPPPVPVAMR